MFLYVSLSVLSRESLEEVVFEIAEDGPPEGLNKPVSLNGPNGDVARRAI